MKRYLFTILLLLCAAPCSAWNWPVITAMQSGGGEGCSEDIGNNSTADSGYSSISPNNLLLIKIVLDCTGIPDINIRQTHFTTDTEKIIFVVYNDSSGTVSTNVWSSSVYNPTYTTQAETITQTATELEPGTYWVGIYVEGGGRVYHSGTSGGDAVSIYNPGTTWPNAPGDLSGVDQAASSNNHEVWISF